MANINLNRYQPNNFPVFKFKYITKFAITILYIPLLSYYNNTHIYHHV